MVERALVRDGEQGVLMTGIELLGVTREGFWAGAEREVAQAAFFELGEFTADVFGWAGDDASDTKLAAESDTNLRAGRRSSLTSERNASVSSVMPCSVLSELCFFSPANGASDNAVAGVSSVPVLRTTSARCSIERHTSNNSAAAFGLATPIAVPSCGGQCVGVDLSILLHDIGVIPQFTKMVADTSASRGAGNAGRGDIDRASRRAVGGGRRIGSAGRIAAAGTVPRQFTSASN